MEEWRPIENTKYEVSSLGRVRSFCREKVRVLRPTTQSDGYKQVAIHGKRYYVARLVMENFQGFSALEVNHIDGNKSNNSLSNLEYTTRTENVRHAFRLGLNEGRKGEAHGSSVLTDKQVLEIREKFVPFRYTHKKLAFEFGVSKSTIAKIISRDLWSHLD